MNLLGVTVKGIKRFRADSFVKVSGKLTALVGPNESGKTSLLRAIELVDPEHPFPENLRSRSYDGEVFVEALFGLDDDDRQFLGLSNTQTARARRDIGESDRQWTLDPPLEPDLDAREGLRSRVNGLIGQLSQLVASGEADVDLGAAQRVAELLASRGIFDEASGSAISEFIELLKTMDPAATALATDLSRHVRASSAILVDEQLEHLAPRFLYFGTAESALLDEYAIERLNRTGAFPALQNLSNLVGLDLNLLRESARRGDPAATVRPMNEANEKLSTAFQEVWTQHNVAISLEGDFRAIDRYLQVFIGEPDGEFFKPSDRSAGLQWFVALYAFLKGAHAPLERPPVLLVDEADIHLHYDAQADLVREMMQQSLTAEVIYTTHSAGCLPPDLSSIRVVEPEVAGWSRVTNKFWAHSDARISSLIIRMGAASFAFTRSRSALITEGPSDFLLLPHLFREIDPDWDSRAIQIVPVLASIAPVQVAELDREAGRVVYLTDNDKAGGDIRAMLESEGIAPERILRLSSAIVEVEDFVSRPALIDAISRVAKVVGMAEPVVDVDVPDTGRGKAVERIMKTWPRTPSKVDLAEFLLDGSMPLLDQVRTEELRVLNSAIVEALS